MATRKDVSSGSSIDAAGFADESDLDSLLNGAGFDESQLVDRCQTLADIGSDALMDLLKTAPAQDSVVGSDNLADLLASAPDASSHEAAPVKQLGRRHRAERHEEDSDVIPVLPTVLPGIAAGSVSPQPTAPNSSCQSDAQFQRVPSEPLDNSGISEAEDQLIRDLCTGPAERPATESAQIELPSSAEADARIQKINKARKKAEAWLVRHQQSVDQREPRQVSKLAEQLAELPASDKAAIDLTLKKLAATRSANAIEHIRSVSNRRQTDVRLCSAECLSLIRHSSAALGLLKLTCDESPRVVDAAVRGIIAQAVPKCFHMLVLMGTVQTRLLPLIQDDLHRLSDDDKPAFVDELKRLIRSKDAAVAACCVTLLARQTGGEYVGAFAKLATHSNAAVRAAAIDGLAQSGKRRVVGLVNAAMADPSVRVRTSAATGLAHLQSPKSIQLLAQALSDPEVSVRFAAARTLSGISDESIAAPVAAAINTETDRQVRNLLVETLCQVGTSAALPVLRTMLRGDDQTQQQALRTIRRHGIKSAEPLVAKTLEGAVEETRRLCVEAFSRMGLKNCLPTLRTLVSEDPSEKVRAAAARGLGMLEDPEAIQPLEESLHDVLIVRSQAVVALGKIGDRAAFPALLAQLKDQSAEIRQLACTAIGKVGNLTNTDPLEELLDDSDAGVRKCADSVLQQLGTHTSFGRLTRRLRRIGQRTFGSSRPTGSGYRLPILKAAVSCVVVLAVVGTVYGVVGMFGSSTAVVTGPPSHVISASVSTDNTTLAVLRKRGVSEYWDLKSGEMNSRFQLGRQTRQLTFAGADEVLLFSRNSVAQWAPKTDPYGGTIKSTLTEGLGGIQRLVSSADGRTAFLFGGKAVTVFDLKDRKIVRNVEIGQSLSAATAVSPDQELIIYGDRSGNIVFASASNGQKVHSFSAKEMLGNITTSPQLNSISFSPDSRLMALAFSTGYIQLWDMTVVEPINMKSCSPAASQVVLHPTEPIVYAGSRGKIVILKDNLESQEIIETDGMSNPLWMEVTADGKTLVVFAEESKELFVFDLTSKTLKHRLKP